MVHLLIHIAVLVPLALFFRVHGYSQNEVLLMLALSFLVDLDHLWAKPIYDPKRCSIGFHWLHKPLAIGLYAIGLLNHDTRVLSSGLLAHMLVDGLHCLLG